MTAPVRSAPAILLDAGGTRVAIDPARGGRVTRLQLAGVEWLWSDERGDTGGYDEWLATRASDGVSTGASDGDALGTAATERVDAPAGAVAAVTRWAGARVALARTVTVQPDGAVRMEYALESRAAESLPVLWGARPTFPLHPATRLDLPVAARVRVWEADGVALGERGAEHRWPVLRLGDPRATPFGPREVDFTFPALAPQHFGPGGSARYACTLFLDLPRTSGTPVRLGVEQDGARLELTVDPRDVPSLRLRIDHAADAPGERGATRRAVGTLGFGPSLGAGEGLDVAHESGDGWGPPSWLAPGTARRWTLTWRGRAAPAGI